MSLKLRFRCEEIDRSGATGPSVTLTPLAVGSDENTLAFAAIPSGKLLLESLRADAAQGFSVGADYVLELTPAAVPEAPPAQEQPSQDPPAQDAPGDQQAAT